MPNYVFIEMEFSNPKTIERFITKGEDGEDIFDFNTLIPMPNELHIECSSRVDEAVAYLKNELPLDYKERFEKSNDFAKYLEIGKVAINNETKYGCRNWYSWSCNNWGTKWNACGSKIDKEKGIVSFSTAWSFPIPIMNKLAEMIPPTEKITIKCAEEDIGSQCGWHTIEDNIFYEDWYESFSDGAIAFAKDLLGIVEDED